MLYVSSSRILSRRSLPVCGYNIPTTGKIIRREAVVLARVTIAILAYYGDGLLAEAIASVLAQTYADYKAVVYDDCSPHDLKKEFDAFADPRLVYVRNEKNLGVWGNTNKAIELRDTEYLQIFHGDDIMFPWMIDELVSVMDENPEAGVAATSFNFIEGEYARPAARPDSEGTLYKARELIRAICEGKVSEPVISSITLRKKTIDERKLRYDPAAPEPDHDFFLTANHAGVEIYLSKIPLLSYRKHPGA
jgi:glycosyltransferase involved in cell wall biosynthesis